MNKYLFLPLLLFLLASCSSSIGSIKPGGAKKDAHTLAVIRRYPRAIIVGGIGQEMYLQLSSYYQEVDSISSWEPEVATTTIGSKHNCSTPSASILFEFDQDKLLPHHMEVIDQLIPRLYNSGKLTPVMVVGHTDEMGSEEYNNALSERRAKAVSLYIEENYADKIVVVSSYGLGEHRPVATNQTEEGRAKNRRVEIIIEEDFK